MDVETSGGSSLLTSPNELGISAGKIIASDISDLSTNF